MFTGNVTFSESGCHSRIHEWIAPRFWTAPECVATEKKVRLKYGPLTIALTRGTYALHYVGKPIVIDGIMRVPSGRMPVRSACLESWRCRD